MDQQQTDKLVTYWLTTAQHDYKTMESLFKSRRYSDCLFYGHIVLEKLLKALVVKATKQSAPYTHDLLVLSRQIEDIAWTEDEVRLLDDVNRFNIRTRYPDFKLKFYKLCKASYTKPYYIKIKDLHKKLCQKLRQKK